MLFCWLRVIGKTKDKGQVTNEQSQRLAPGFPFAFVKIP